MADVAQKLEELEMVMGSAQEDGLSHLDSDTVHYDPSDIRAGLRICSMSSTLCPQFRSVPHPN
ncbi:Transcriptional factor DELLA, N-terminal [Dillenia turbinata]|uniref:Transcriptional factor DELLA, N-terminal n=1 Tax=Dillenia turbinata TaxID=194707 RepID=A0AAN8UW24_9MAGN